MALEQHLKLGKNLMQMSDDVEDALETIDYAIYNLENDLQKLRDKFDRLKESLEVTSE